VIARRPVHPESTPRNAAKIYPVNSSDKTIGGVLGGTPVAFFSRSGWRSLFSASQTVPQRGCSTMKVVICGAGRMGVPLTRAAHDAGHQVTLLTRRPELLPPGETLFEVT